MDHILYTAMSGARQSLDRQGVVSNNLANASTSGFRAQLHASRAVPVQGAGELPTRISAAETTPGADFTPGPVNATGRDLDVAMGKDAWLAVQAPDGDEAYTRRGDLQVDGDGLVNVAGHPVMGDGGPLIVPLGARLFVGADGTVSAISPGQDAENLVAMGRLKLVNGAEAKLTRGEDGLFRAEGGNLQQDEAMTVTSGALEGSNVSAVETMVAMIDSARRYEMQMKVISSADENAQRANQLLSLQG
ncbi:flagellar basal body rod protein FlgF [Pistricoccus aurantiacus]|uniref:Flagellar basal-body rod protein FlgF n=1 Tax=Pistricoccus aurantiacus TaxID=1883414 RepID=A0A5B8SR92_9GAMM|nr:flagellar basal body rod protein FlgF [Pistricoccus aurantiacus]QEA39689.1 flagellar basal body rod protein FlgF [Pistricoccus aurantiacus]